MGVSGTAWDLSGACAKQRREKGLARVVEEEGEEEERRLGEPGLRGGKEVGWPGREK